MAIWGLGNNFGLLEEQQAFSTAEPSLQSLTSKFYPFTFHTLLLEEDHKWKKVCWQRSHQKTDTCVREMRCPPCFCHAEQCLVRHWVSSDEHFSGCLEFSLILDHEWSWYLCPLCRWTLFFLGAGYNFFSFVLILTVTHDARIKGGRWNWLLASPSALE